MPPIPLSRHSLTPAFSSASLRQGRIPLGHFLSVDHFQMSQPTFPPHPHAGFSAVTWMVPWSAGGFVNRDSRGDRSRIGPGALHWTLAGAGMMHEEIPETPGTACEGLQIFVKLPAAQEELPPAAYHLDAAEIPKAAMATSTLSILAGAYGALRSPVPTHASTALLHVAVQGSMTIQVPAGLDAFAVVLRGQGRVADQAAGPDTALSLPSGEVSLEGAAMDLFVGWSEAMSGTPTFQGPFCMFQPDRLLAARRAYAAGAMGTLAPSAVQWVR